MTEPAVPTLAALVLPDRHPVSAFLDDVREAERSGVRAVWTYDHLTWPLLRDEPWYGAVPLLAAAAMVTDRVRLGTQVASPNFRHPVPFAKELMTLDQLTGGRLEVGVGVGTEGLDALVLGEEPISRSERTSRFEEWLGLLDTLLTQPVTTVHGERYSAVDAHQLPGCVQSPRLPFTVAATGPRALRLAARYGQGWVTYGPYGAAVEPEEWLTVVEQQSRRLTDALAAEGRAAEDLRRSAQIGLETSWPFESADRYADTLGRLTEAGIDEVGMHWPRPDGRGVSPTALPLVLSAHGL